MRSGRFWRRQVAWSGISGGEASCLESNIGGGERRRQRRAATPLRGEASCLASEGCELLASGGGELLASEGGELQVERSLWQILREVEIERERREKG